MRPEYIDVIKQRGELGWWQTPVLDVGGQTIVYQHNQKYDMKLIMFRWNLDYLNLDFYPGDGIDIVDDAQGMAKIPSHCIGTVLCLGMLEHVENPWKVIESCYRVLKPNGTIMVSAPFIYPVHSDADFWRFTEQGMRLLTRKFERMEFKELGGLATNNHEIYFIGRKSEANNNEMP